jgi:DinB superfamily
VIYVEQLRSLIPEARDVISGLSESQINWHPLPGSWSIGECIAHLNTTNALYVRNLEQSFHLARQQGWTNSGGEPRPGMFERWFSFSLEPPYRIRFKAPKQFEPPSTRYERDELLARWVSNHERLLHLALDNSDIDWKKTKVSSPVSNRIKLSAIGVFAVIGAHDRRHLWQAQQIRSKLAV